MPPLMRLGLAVFALGVAGDVGVHLIEAVGGGALVEHSPGELVAHLVTFVGMVLIFTGVVVDGVRQSRPRRSAGRSKGVA